MATLESDGELRVRERRLLSDPNRSLEEIRHTVIETSFVAERMVRDAGLDTLDRCRLVVPHLSKTRSRR